VSDEGLRTYSTAVRYDLRSRLTKAESDCSEGRRERLDIEKMVGGA
jgi:hypothetical protein